jgi:hypothetical protein
VQNFSLGGKLLLAFPCITLVPFLFLGHISSLITMYQQNRHCGYISRNQVCYICLSVNDPQAGRLHYRDRDKGGSGDRRYAIHDEDDDATDDVLCLGHPI